MDSEIVCNFKKCRKRLDTVAWVTACSHIFCNEDGSREFEKSLKCPACETSLSGQLDVVRLDLNPTEQYKSMILTGHRPDVILDICSRAMSFWIYQVHQEIIYQEYSAKKSRDRFNELEQFCEESLNKSRTEITSLKQHLESTKKELDSQKRKVNELSEKLMEKSRQHQKLQAMYETLRRKCISPAVFEHGNQSQERKLRHLPSFNTDEEKANENFTLHPATMQNHNHQPAFNLLTPTEARFTLELQTPRHENRLGVLRHCHQKQK